MTAKKVTLNLTGILIQDKSDRGYTAYFAEFPEAIADGATVEDAQRNLMNSLKIMLESRRLENYVTDKKAGGIIQRNYEFELA